MEEGNVPLLAMCYGLLSDLFFYPDFSVFKKFNRLVTFMGLRVSFKADLEKLQCEYTRLFVTNFPSIPCPPYGSFYMNDDGLLGGRYTIEFMSFIKTLGLEFSDSYPEAPDHVSAQLELLEWMTREKLFEEKRFFLNRFFLPWIFKFTERVKKNDTTGFYKASAEMVESLMALEG